MRYKILDVATFEDGDDNRSLILPLHLLTSIFSKLRVGQLCNEWEGHFIGEKFWLALLSASLYLCVSTSVSSQSLSLSDNYPMLTTRPIFSQSAKYLHCQSDIPDVSIILLVR